MDGHCKKKIKKNGASKIEVPFVTNKTKVRSGQHFCVIYNTAPFLTDYRSQKTAGNSNGRELVAGWWIFAKKVEHVLLVEPRTFKQCVLKEEHSNQTSGHGHGAGI